MPDFDVDFCQERRDEVIRYVQEKYGHDRVAQIITLAPGPRGASRRGSCAGMPYRRSTALQADSERDPANPVTLQEAIDRSRRCRKCARRTRTSRLMETR